MHSSVRIFLKRHNLDSIYEEKKYYHFNIDGILVNIGTKKKSIPLLSMAKKRLSKKLQDSKHDVLLYNLGNAYSDQQNLLNAAACFNKALEIEPNKLNARNNLGVVFRRSGNLEEALIQFKKSIEIDPAQSETWFDMGNIYADQKNFREAKKCYQKALSIDPTNNDALYNIKILEKIFPSENERSMLIRMKPLGTPEDDGDGEYKYITGKNPGDLALNIAAEGIKAGLRQMKDTKKEKEAKEDKKKTE